MSLFTQSEQRSPPSHLTLLSWHALHAFARRGAGAPFEPCSATCRLNRSLLAVSKYHS